MGWLLVILSTATVFAVILLRRRALAQASAPPEPSPTGWSPTVAGSGWIPPPGRTWTMATKALLGGAIVVWAGSMVVYLFGHRIWPEPPRRAVVTRVSATKVCVDMDDPAQRPGGDRPCFGQAAAEIPLQSLDPGDCVTVRLRHPQRYIAEQVPCDEPS